MPEKKKPLIIRLDKSPAGPHATHWVPLRDRYGVQFLDELDKRTKWCAQQYQNSPESREEMDSLKNLGREILHFQWKAGMNPTEFSEAAGIDEMLLFFAEEGLVRPEELTKDGMLDKINTAIGQLFGTDPNLYLP